jgi:rod shape determining protein RodA
VIKRIWRFATGHLDLPLLGFLALLLLVSLVMVFSASGQSATRLTSHGANIVVALTVLWAAARVPPQYWMQFALPLYVLGLVLLVAVGLFGEVVNGARRWLDLGIMRLQPSEIMRLAVPLALAHYYHKHEHGLKLRHHAAAALILALPLTLIVRQPDLGTSLLIGASGFYVIFLAGLPARLMLGVAALGAASLPVLWHQMHDYQQQRVLTLFDPSQDPLGTGYHTIQSTIAVGSGGFMGKGWLNGTQTQLDFLPEAHTDFIFAVFSEEFGFFGNVLLLLLYTAIIARGLVLAAGASDLFGRLLSASVTLTFFTYAFVNIGMVSGILPVVGVPLPLVSYGGTSMVTVLLSFGILMSVRTHRKLVKT